jgi:hypothetical protein
VYALNQYCKDVHSMEYDVEDYWVYEFAKVRDMLGNGALPRPLGKPPNRRPRRGGLGPCGRDGGRSATRN